MSKILGKADKIITTINRVYLICAIAFMFIFVFTNVVGRYLFSRTFNWVDEIGRYLMVSMAFLGMGLAMRQGSHSAFTIFQNALPDKGRKAIRLIVLVIAFAFIATFCYLGLLYALNNMENRTEYLRWRNGMWYLMIPLGSFLFIWHTAFIAKAFINESRGADIERDIASGDALLKGSEFLNGMSANEKIDGGKN